MLKRVLCAASLIAAVFIPTTSAALEVAPAAVASVDVDRIAIDVPAAYDSATSSTMTLDGWIARPAGVDRRLPVVLMSLPYLGSCHAGSSVINVDAAAVHPCELTPDHPAWWATDSTAPESAYLHAWFGFPPVRLIEAGYAIAFVSLRGTGNSGGCFEFGGRNEQRDQVEIIEWLAAKPWSTGKVGMVGLSYPAWTALQAAVQAPSALKTTITTGVVTDVYTFFYGPQGAAFSTTMLGVPLLMPGSSMLPPAGAETSFNPLAWLDVVTDRPCPDVLEVFAKQAVDTMNDAADRPRDGAFYDERRLTDRLHNVKASSLIAHGFRDGGHEWQEDVVWKHAPQSPKWQLEGEWGHSFPTTASWQTDVLQWLGYWLKDIGEPPRRLGYVDYFQSDALSDPTSGAWREAQTWPPPADNQVLYLDDSRLSAAAPASDQSFISVPDPRDTHRLFSPLGVHEARPWPAACPTRDPIAEERSLRFMGEPLRKAVEIAGNPFAYLKLSSSDGGGLVTVTVLAVNDDWTCTLNGVPSGLAVVARGSADTRFHNGNYEPRRLVGPTHVRVDLTNMATRVPAGARLGVLVHHGEVHTEHFNTDYAPTITVHGGVDASQLVLPVTRRSLGGANPTVEYPSRPFTYVQ